MAQLQQSNSTYQISISVSSWTVKPLMRIPSIKKIVFWLSNLMNHFLITWHEKLLLKINKWTIITISNIIIINVRTGIEEDTLLSLKSNWLTLSGFSETIFLLGGDLNCIRMPGLAAVFDFTRSADSAGYIALPADTDKGTIQNTIYLFQ